MLNVELLNRLSLGIFLKRYRNAKVLYLNILEVSQRSLPADLNSSHHTTGKLQGDVTRVHVPTLLVHGDAGVARGVHGQGVLTHQPTQQTQVMHCTVNEDATCKGRVYPLWVMEGWEWSSKDGLVL